MKTPNVSGKSFQSTLEASKNKRGSRAGGETEHGEGSWTHIAQFCSSALRGLQHVLLIWGSWCPHLGHGCNHTCLQAVVRRKGNRRHMVGAP